MEENAEFFRFLRPIATEIGLCFRCPARLPRRVGRKSEIRKLERRRHKLWLSGSAFIDEEIVFRASLVKVIAINSEIEFREE